MVTEKTLQNGQVVSYREFGSGPNLFLIHGFGGSPRDWETVAQELSPRFHVIVPNLGPVFLDHENADSLSFKNHVQVLIDFILSFSKQGQPNYLAAASYGAMVSLAALIEAAQWGTSASR